MESSDRGAAIGVRSAGALIGLIPLLVLPLLIACTPSRGTATPTPAPVSTAPIVFATTAPATVQTTFPTPIPPPPTATLRALPTALPAAQRSLYVVNTGAEGLALRRTPVTDGERIAVLPEGAALTPTGQEEQAAGRLWRQVRDSQGREGWVAADFLSASAPASALAAASPVADRTPPPTQAIGIPPPPPTPTRAPTRVPETSAPVAPPTARPQAPAVVVPTIGTRFNPPVSPTPR